MKSYKLTLALVALILALSIVVTGFGAPGFFIDKEPMPEDPPVYVPTAEQTAVPERVENTGNSAALHERPLSFFSIDAEENAFDRDRTFTVSEIPEESLPAYEDTLVNDVDYPGVILAGYDVNAGMEPDEIMPGTYTMTLDLAGMGVSQAYWDYLTAFRVDGDGYWNEYVTSIENGSMVIESAQNCLLFIACSVAVGYAIVDEMTPDIAAMGFKRYFEWEDYVYVYEGNRRYAKKLFRMRFTFSSNVQVLITRKDNIYKSYRTKLSVDEVKQMIAAEKGIEEWRDVRGPELHARFALEADKLARTDPDYVALTNEIESLLGNPNQKSSLLESIGGMLLEARTYLKDVVKVRVPTYVIDVRLSTVVGGNSAGVTINPVVIKKSSLLLNTSYLEENPVQGYADMLATVTHELFHACQRRYKAASFANIKFDEATAQMIETDCTEYFLANGKMKAHPKVENVNCIERYAVPLDKYSVTYDGVETAFAKKDRADLGYTLAYLVRYLRDRNSPNMSYDTLLKAYDSFWTSPTMSELLKTAFGLSDESLTTQYQLFARRHQAMFYELAVKLYSSPSAEKAYAFPVTGRDEEQNGVRVNLTDRAYTVRTRHIIANRSEGYSGDIAMLLVTAPEFKEKLPDTDVYAVGPKGAKKMRYGLFFEPVSALDEFYVIESDGGLSDTGNTSYYTAWFLEAPEEVESKIEDGLLKFKLPETSDVAKKGYIDGYRVTITAGDGTKTEKNYKISGAGQAIAIKVGKLIGENTKEEDASFSISVCEYIKDGAVKYYGPESDSRRSMEAAMNETLAQEGAEDGVITVSLGWQTEDDLDLHVVTPSGREIYYSNKEADGGRLDVDMQVSTIVANPAEHVVFKESPPQGTYTVRVVTYTDRTEDYATPFIVVVKVGTQSRTYRLTASQYSNDVCTFTYGSPEGQESGSEHEDNPRAGSNP